MKSKRPAKRKPKRAPKLKKIKLPEAVVLHVEVPPKMIPAILPGPDPHVMRIVPLPADKSWSSQVMDFFFGVEKK